jgi:hypothetical protein
MIVSVLVLSIIMFVIEPTVFGFLTDIIINDAVPATGFFQMPYLLFTMYPIEITVILLAMLVFAIVGNWSAFSYARFAKEKKEVFHAMGYATANLANAFYVSVFAGMIFLFFFAMLGITTTIANYNSILGIIVGFVVAIAALLAYLVLAFLPTAMAAEKTNLKEGLKKSSEFVRTRALWVIIFVFLVGMVYYLVANIGFNLADSTENEYIAFAVQMVFLLVATAYSGIAVPLYFVSKKK